MRIKSERVESGLHLDLHLNPDEAGYFKWLFERVAESPAFRYIGDDIQNAVMALAAAIPGDDERDRYIREKIRRSRSD